MWDRHGRKLTLCDWIKLLTDDSFLFFKLLRLRVLLVLLMMCIKFSYNWYQPIIDSNEIKRTDAVSIYSLIITWIILPTSNVHLLILTLALQIQ